MNFGVEVSDESMNTVFVNFNQDSTYVFIIIIVIIIIIIII
jgi:hypothetical protein